MLGISPITMVVCPGCQNGHSLKSSEKKEIFSNPDKLLDTKKCLNSDCKHDYSFLDGIVQGYLSKSPSLESMFESTIPPFTGQEKVEVGISHTVSLTENEELSKQGISDFSKLKINKIDFGCNDGFAELQYKVAKNNKSFNILSSEVKGVPGGVKIGELLSVDWIAYGTTEGDTHSIPYWQHLLTQCRMNISKHQFNVAYFLNYVTLESFLDSVLTFSFKKKGISENVSSVILKRVDGEVKLKKLLKEMENIDITNIDGIGRRAVIASFKLISKKRNQIAHGHDISISKEEATDAFEFVIRAIFYILIKMKN